MDFSVGDTGTGIPSHDIGRIFERFHRVHNQQGRSNEGSGIGLALTQELVKLHGGEINVESTFGYGTTFHIHIPVGNTHLPPEHVFSGPESLEMDTFGARAYGQSVVEEAGRCFVHSDQSDMQQIHKSCGSSLSSIDSSNWQVQLSSQGSRLLVVDDNEDMRLYVRGILLPFYEVMEAANGQDAFTIATQRKPDMIISDVMMSGVDGFGNFSLNCLIVRITQSYSVLT